LAVEKRKMKTQAINAIKKGFENIGIKIIAKKTYDNPPDLEKEFYALQAKCSEYTMTSTERLYSIYNSIRYLNGNNVEGAIVECGVWKGGSSMMAALSLKEFKDTSREMWLYDTYEGMSAPTEKDVNYRGESSEPEWKDSQRSDHNEWCYSSLDEVKSNLNSTTYPSDKISYIKGKVEDTIPGTVPEKIALLRLDTDWYESTYHELKHLYPRLVKGGILIIDDYGFWKGSREACDQYFKENNIKLMLNRIDKAGRLLIKTA
jgi:O-methyltransferase